MGSRHRVWVWGAVALIGSAGAPGWAGGCTNVVEQPADSGAAGEPDGRGGGVAFRTLDGTNGAGDDQPEATPGELPDAAAPEDAGPLPLDVASPTPDVPEDAGAPADVGPPACVEGSVCDDGDLCTYNDQCTGGACAGTPIDCGDALPCTDDACVGGLCQAPIAASFCLIDGICWNDGQGDPTSPCRICDPAQATKKWTGNDGFPCDDGDSCTWPDVCMAGECTTTPAACPEDDDPCTTAKCVAGACTLAPIHGGPCDGGDPCVMGAKCVAGACVGGEPLDGDSDGYVASSCGGYDCDDEKGWVHPGVAEACDDGLDNDCDGVSDDDDPACGPFGEPCSYHDDCYPDGYCGRWATTGATICSPPCAGSADCPAGQRCTKVPGSAQAGFCEPTPEGLLAPGEVCTDDADCASGVCEGHNCAGLCLDEASCPGGAETCHAVGEPALGLVTASCGPDQPGKKVTGQVCQSGGFECTSGHCDVLAPNAGSMTCSSLCTTKADCMPTQECNIVYYADVPNPNTVPYHPQFPSATFDAVTACYTPTGGVGAQLDGTTCTLNSQCKTYHCLPLLPGDSTHFCTRLCSVNEDCLSGMECKMEALNLTSSWLQVGAAIGAKPANQNGWTFVGICKFP